jgi:hypothetical protein
MTRKLTRYLAAQAQAQARAAAGAAASALAYGRASSARAISAAHRATRPAPLGVLWDPTLLDRLQAPLTRHHY